MWDLSTFLHLLQATEDSLFDSDKKFSLIVDIKSIYHLHFFDSGQIGYL